MTHSYLKRRSVGTETADQEVSEKVRDMIAGLRERGEDEARTLARDFDGWDGPIVVEESAVRAARTPSPRRCSTTSPKPTETSARSLVPNERRSSPSRSKSAPVYELATGWCR